MKKTILVIIGMILCFNLISQDVQENLKREVLNYSRSALAFEIGVKNITGIRATYSFYVTPDFAIDLGLGVGLKLVNVGLRASYIFTGNYLLLLDKTNPYIGASLIYNPLSTNFPFVSINGTNTSSIQINPALNGRIMIGLETITSVGTLYRFHIGYSQSFNENPWTINFTPDPSLERALRIFYGGGISIGITIGSIF